MYVDIILIVLKFHFIKLYKYYTIRQFSEWYFIDWYKFCLWIFPLVIRHVERYSKRICKDTENATKISAHIIQLQGVIMWVLMAENKFYHKKAFNSWKVKNIVRIKYT